MDEMVNVKLTRKAADCLAWFADHDFYPDDLSGIIVRMTENWASREHKTLEDMYIDGSYEAFMEKLEE